MRPWIQLKVAQIKELILLQKKRAVEGLGTRVSKGQDNSGQDVSLSRGKKISLSRRPFVPGQKKSFLVPLSLCPGKRAAATILGQTSLSWDILGTKKHQIKSSSVAENCLSDDTLDCNFHDTKDWRWYFGRSVKFLIKAFKMVSRLVFYVTSVRPDKVMLYRNWQDKQHTRYNLIDTKYRQMAFQSARWHCSLALFGNPWSNKSEWWSPEVDNPAAE